jgi:hypothetical protein
MNKVVDLVQNSLEFYDGNMEKYNSFIEKINFVKTEKGSEDIPIINFYDSDKKLIFKSRYEILGTYISNTLTWTWAWANAMYPKKLTNISRRLLNYGVELESSPDNFFLKTELITSRYKISNKIQLELHASIASYLSKQPLVYKYKLPVIQESYSEEQNIKMLDTKKYKNVENYTVYYLFLLDFANYKE